MSQRLPMTLFDPSLFLMISGSAKPRVTIMTDSEHILALLESKTFVESWVRAEDFIEI